MAVAVKTEKMYKFKRLQKQLLWKESSLYERENMCEKPYFLLSIFKTKHVGRKSNYYANYDLKLCRCNNQRVAFMVFERWLYLVTEFMLLLRELKNSLS